MIHIGLAGDALMTLKTDAPTGIVKPRLVLAWRIDETEADLFHFVTTHEHVETDEGVRLLCLEQLLDPTTGITYELVPQKGDTVVKETQIDLLANYIMAHCPAEIGSDDPQQAVGPVEVAVRLMGRMADGIEHALVELGVPGESYPAPAANAVEILREALGLWGQGLEN